ncbi:MAG TPA: ABC transporter permease, partial [Nitrososphaeria archaeon]|nr:ABC transporter permease [Nitrososphaeria archaeon]
MLLTLLKKEVKELLMEKSILIGMVIVPLIIFPVMGGLTSAGMGFAAQRSGQEVVVGVVDLDHTNLTMMLLPHLMEDEGIQAIMLNCRNREDCIQAAENSDVKFFILIPKGFSKNFTRGVPGVVETIYTFEHFT